MNIPLLVVLTPSSSCNTTLFLEASTVNVGQMGDRESLCTFGSSARTKDSQYAMSSSLNASSMGVKGVKTVVPFVL